MMICILIGYFVIFLKTFSDESGTPPARRGAHPNKPAVPDRRRARLTSEGARFAAKPRANSGSMPERNPGPTATGGYSGSAAVPRAGR